MIDEYITLVQSKMAMKSSEFFGNKKLQGSRLSYGAYVVVPIVIGVTGSMDYIKLTAACIEEVSKMIFLFPARFFSPRLARRVATHYKDAKNYSVLFIYKILYGAPKDVRNIYQSISKPFMDVDSLFSFYGFKSARLSEWQRMHPSLLA